MVTSAHIFLEKNIEALTVKKMRQVLKEIDVDFNQKVSLTEFLIFNYKIDYHYLVNAVVDDKESEALIALANEKLAAAQAALEESQVSYRHTQKPPTGKFEAKSYIHCAWNTRRTG